MSSRAVAALLALVLPLGLGATAPHVAQAGPVTPDVVNGRTPEPGEFGFLAAVKVSSGGSGYYSCGGSFVSTTQVVTAAHCFYDDKGKRLTSASAAPGDGTTWPSSFVSASKIEVHAQYSPSAESYDIALITLSKPIAGVATALIPTESQWRVLAAAGSSVSSAGWGTTSSGGSSPDDFRVADLTVIPDSVCGRASGTYQVGSVTDDGKPITLTLGVYTRLVTFLPWLADRGVVPDDVGVPGAPTGGTDEAKGSISAVWEI